ncbi:UNVERIFIED_CONTAM: hypothetical protein Sradi_5623400 [Sesamum radiatum]|uniref:Uncharacterized protein n=1 Tax=Sesamum radiatum TaxID=300843 RepID=A0AAW2KYV2_SESRA
MAEGGLVQLAMKCGIQRRWSTIVLRSDGGKSTTVSERHGHESPVEKMNQSENYLRGNVLLDEGIRMVPAVFVESTGRRRNRREKFAAKVGGNEGDLQRFFPFFFS